VMDTASVRHAYRRWAPVYDYTFGKVAEAGRKHAVEIINKRKGRVLEVGVGTGLSLPCYGPHLAVTGIDLSAHMLAIARQRAARLPGRRIALLAMDAETLAFQDGSFDCVTLAHVLSVTPSPQRLIAEVRRVCRRGGTIFILNHFSGSLPWRLLERVLRSAADRIGFRSDFNLADEVLRHDWEVRSLRKVNLAGLSTLVEVRNR